MQNASMNYSAAGLSTEGFQEAVLHPAGEPTRLPPQAAF